MGARPKCKFLDRQFGSFLAARVILKTQPERGSATGSAFQQHTTPHYFNKPG